MSWTLRVLRVDIESKGADTGRKREDTERKRGRTESAKRED